MIRDKMTLASASVIPRYLTASIVMVTSAGGDDSDNVIHQNIIWTGPVEHRCFSSQAVDGKKKHFHIKVFPSNQTWHLYFWMNTNFMQISPDQVLNKYNIKSQSNSNVSARLWISKQKNMLASSATGANCHYVNNCFPTATKSSLCLNLFHQIQTIWFKPSRSCSPTLPLCHLTKGWTFYRLYTRPFVIVLQLLGRQSNVLSDDKKFSNPQFWGEIFKFIHSFIPVWLCLSLSKNYYVSVSPTRTETLCAREELCFILAWIHLGIKSVFSDSYHSAALERKRKEGSRSVKIMQRRVQTLSRY